MVSKSILSIKAILPPFLLVTFLVTVFSCKEEETVMPTNLPPRVALDEAYNITRNEATVSGSVTPVGSGHICSMRDSRQDSTRMPTGSPRGGKECHRYYNRKHQQSTGKARHLRKAEAFLL